MNTNHVVEKSSLLQVEQEMPPSPALHMSAALVHRADNALCLHRQEQVVHELQSTVNRTVHVQNKVTRFATASTSEHRSTGSTCTHRVTALDLQVLSEVEAASRGRVQSRVGL